MATVFRLQDEVDSESKSNLLLLTHWPEGIYDLRK